MPLYEYRCTECGEHVEVLQPLGDAPLAECGRCGGKMEKLLSAPALQFRGSGWYITDYARKGNGNGASAPAGDGGKAQKPSAPTAASEASGPAKSGEGASASAST